ncbi:hypothetical protein [Micromonospora sp. NPDC005173]|uniref:hypothetical protein n=1 Tax=Micromonospora sp. NPDC005173 TaxID=3157165 RepID=UPI00339FD335
MDYRAANIRAGFVYVISNIGAFGEDVGTSDATTHNAFRHHEHGAHGASVKAKPLRGGPTAQPLTPAPHTRLPETQCRNRKNQRQPVKIPALTGPAPSWMTQRGARSGRCAATTDALIAAREC